MKNGCVMRIFWTPRARASATSVAISFGDRWHVPRIALCWAIRSNTSSVSGRRSPAASTVEMPVADDCPPDWES